MINYDLSVHTGLTQLRIIADNYKTGKWVSFAKWLQRLEQEKKWTRSNRRNAKAYMRGLLQTQGTVQGFLVCDIDFLIKDIIRQKREKPDLEKIWLEMLQWLDEKKNLGATAVILDGQNRLKFAICNFIYGDLAIPLVIDGEEKNDVTYASLSEDAKEQVDKHDVITHTAYAGDVVSVVERLVAINEGESWSEHEKRCVQLTPVAYEINRIVSHPDVVKVMNKLNKLKIFARDYALEKKGDSLFVAEYLHFIRHKRVGTKKGLTDLYHQSDDKLRKQLTSTNDMFLWIVRNIPSKHIVKELSKEVLRDLFIFTSMLTNSDTYRSEDISYNIKLNMIKSPEVYLTRVIEKIKELLADKEANILPSKDKNGNTVYLAKNAIPASFLGCHKNAGQGDLEGRVRHFIPHFNELLEQCVNDGTLTTKDPRKISKYDRMRADAKFDGDPNERFETKNLTSTNSMELDHKKSVAKGGTADDDNLEFTSRNNNRRKGSN